MSGQLIGHRYRVLRKIGEGGMAVVHIAVDEKLGRDVAIKILRDRYENHDEIRVRFQHEARAISAFDHPNILKIYDFSGEDSRQLWIVTELIHGRNVAQILETTPSGWLHPVIATSITREICRALTAAHDHGIVHRDVKPDNVMITHQGTVKLMDFGIAKIQRITSMTQTGMFMGSPSYMSPEQVRGRDIDSRSDIYSLGVLFYELVTGKLPFTGASTADVAMRILSGEFAHPRFIMAGIPAEIDRCIVQCMDLLPENRPQTAEEVGSRLDAVLSDLGLESSMRELDRCFKDPKAYGERLARILKVTDSRPAPTVLISDKPVWSPEVFKSPIPRPDISGAHLPSGSQRRDHLLPPRSVPHVSKRAQSAEQIAADLPERRHQQRTTHMHAPQNTVHQALVEARSNHHNQYQPTPAMNPPPAPSRPRHASPARRAEVRPVSRIVPAVPRKNIHRVRYVVHHEARVQSSSSWSTKLMIAALLLASVGIFWLGTNRNATNRSKTNISQVHKQKRPVPVPTDDSQKPTAPSSQGTETANPSSKDPEKTVNSKPPQDDTAKTANGGTKSEAQSKQKQLADNRKSQGQEKSSAANRKNQLTAPSAGKANASPKNPATAPQMGQTPAATKAQPQPAPQTALSIPVLKPSTEVEDPETQSEIPATVSSPKKGGEPPGRKEISAQSTIAIMSTPAAELYIDGRRFGTTNDQGTSSEWIEVTAGSHRVELRRAGFSTRIETIQAPANDRRKFGPFTLMRGEVGPAKSGSFKLTLATNLPPAEVTIINIDSRASQKITLTQPTQTINLDRGIYEVTMNRKGDIRKRRIDFSGATQQLTFSVEFKDPGQH